MFPMIPEDLSGLTTAKEIRAKLDSRTAAELRTMADEIKPAAKEALAAGRSDPEALAKIQWALGVANEARALADSKDLADKLDKDLEDPEPEPEPEAAAPEPDPDPDDEPDDDDDPADPDAGGGGVALATKPKVRTTTGVTAAPDTKSGRLRVDQVLAADSWHSERVNVDGGEKFGSWTDVAAALATAHEQIQPVGPKKHPVAYVPGRFEQHQLLDANPLNNLHLFEQLSEIHEVSQNGGELTADFCAPTPPTYDMACWNTDRRPVRGSLSAFKPDARGSVAIYQSPSLSDITTGFGQWTIEDDDDPEAEKTCAVVECGDSEVYRLYGIYRCLTVKHLMAMTFPELVEAWLNRLAAATARYAEKLLLEAMATETDQLTARELGYNGTTSLTTTVLNYLMHYQEMQRWDVPMMDMWTHRSVLYAIKADLMRRRTTNGTRIDVPSDAFVANLFREVGVEPHFFLDQPSWMTPLPSMQVTGVLGQFPRNVEMIIAPRGKFAVMDRGQLSIGVTGNNYYRDTGNLLRNEITFFVENFEGLVNTTSCPAHLLTLDNLCWNGQQIADIVINCEGGDEVGAAS